MDPIQPKFFQTSLEIEHHSRMLSLRGLVSQSGVTKIYLDGDLPPYWKGVIGEEILVHLDKVQIEGVLLPQYVEAGVFYEIKFRSLDEPIRLYLEQRLQAQGISPGWQRKYPRIPVKGIQDPDLPVPNLCVVRFIGQEIFVNVMNFTLGGIRIETLGDNLGELKAGSILHFDLIISTGGMLSSLSAEIRNIAVHDSNTRHGKTLTRSFGLKFLEMGAVNEQKYRALIRNYCEILQKRLLGEK